MNLATRLLLPFAAAAAIAAPAYAQTFRIPTDSAPAIEVTKQTGWTEKYDDYGNLTLFADNQAGAILLRTIGTGPGEKMPATADVANLILNAAGAKPYSRTEPATFAGGPAEAFYSTMTIEGGPTVQLRLVIRKLGTTHLAVGVTMIPETTPADKRAGVEAQFAAVRIITR